MTNAKLRYMYFWLSFALGYVFPFTYYAIKLGVYKEVHKTSVAVAMPIFFISIVAILKLCVALPKLISTWKPSFLKGIVKSIPIYLITILLITLGLTIKTLIDKNLTEALHYYFEFVVVFFGSLCLSSILDAFHIKYKELDQIEKGYVLGVVNK